MFFIESDRLKLIPLKHEQLVLCKRDRAALEKQLGLNLSAMVIDTHYQDELQQALNGFWLPNTQAYPDLYHWYTNWEVVLKSINTTIGGIGFGGYPDDFGETSVGYVMDEKHRCNGYATEAVLALSQWGFSYSILKSIIADTEVNNLASQQVLVKAGFKIFGNEKPLHYYRLTKPAKIALLQKPKYVSVTH
jgi:ribosomal-protein-alanine N-acetyltransferase